MLTALVAATIIVASAALAGRLHRERAARLEGERTIAAQERTIRSVRTDCEVLASRLGDAQAIIDEYLRPRRRARRVTGAAPAAPAAAPPARPAERPPLPVPGFEILSADAALDASTAPASTPGPATAAPSGLPVRGFDLVPCEGNEAPDVAPALSVGRDVVAEPGPEPAQLGLPLAV